MPKSRKAKDEEERESDTNPVDRRPTHQRDLKLREYREEDEYEKMSPKHYGDPAGAPEDAKEYMMQARKGGYVKKMAKGGAVMANCGASVPPAQKRK